MGLSRARATGTLYLLREETKKVVFFEKGTPVFVRSNVQSECLGQRLATDGLITQEQCDQTLEAIRRTGKKQGELLVEMGIPTIKCGPAPEDPNLKPGTGEVQKISDLVAATKMYCAASVEICNHLPKT